MRNSPDKFPRLISVGVDRDLENHEAHNDDLDDDFSTLDAQPVWKNLSVERLSSGLHEVKGLSVDERGVLATLLVQQRTYSRNIELVRRGQSSEQVFILQKGWACATRYLPSGARQVLSVYVPGDIIRYPAAMSGADTRPNVVTLTDAIAAEVGIDRLHQALEIAPNLSRKMMWNPARAIAILEERLVSLGRRTARARAAHFFLELSLRLEPDTTGYSLQFPCPLSQYVIADALGLSAEHLNRILRQLRTGRLLRVRSGSVKILDLEGLIRLADFDAGYLLSNV